MRISGEGSDVSAGINDNASVLESIERDAGHIISDTRPLAELTAEEAASIRIAEFLNIYTPRNSYEPKLPITSMRNKILETIESNRFSIIQGGTGCGKTTQVNPIKHMLNLTCQIFYYLKKFI